MYPGRHIRRPLTGLCGRMECTFYTVTHTTIHSLHLHPVPVRRHPIGRRAHRETVHTFGKLASRLNTNNLLKTPGAWRVLYHKKAILVR